MRLSRLLGAICGCALTALAFPAAAVTIDFSNDAGSVISFDNTDDCVSPGDVGCFSFVPSLTNIDITSGTAAGLLGNLDGTFGVGTITALGGGLETALVNGTGTLELFDAQGGAVYGTVNWVDIFTYGTVGGLNVGGTANLTNIQVGGNGPLSDPDLIALSNAPGGIITLSFQFASSTSLTDLFSGNDGSLTSTSFSGSISTVPIPPAVWLFGSGLVGLIGMIRRKRVT